MRYHPQTCVTHSVHINFHTSPLCAEMDAATQRGYTPKYVAEQVLDALEGGVAEVTLAPVHHWLAAHVGRSLLPELLFQVMENMAKNPQWVR